MLGSLYCAYIATVPFAPHLSEQSPDPPSSSSDEKQDQSTSTTPSEASPFVPSVFTPRYSDPHPPQANNNKDVVWELLFSLPTTRLTSLITASFNTLLLLLAVDFVYSPVIDSAIDVTFTRLGAVYPDAAKITVRYPLSGTSATEHNVTILWRPATAAAAAAEPWSDGPTLHLQPDFDWTKTTKLTKLWPSTEYECTHTNFPIII
jgi:alkaline phosphatase D